MSRSPPPKLSDLPFPLLSHILSFLLPPRRHPRISVSLFFAESQISELPQPLLAAVLASPLLAAAAAKMLGPRAAYLTSFATRGGLAKFVTAFATSVKAVSTWEPALEHTSQLFQFQQQHHRFYNNLHTESVHLFSALAADAVRLEVLDLRHVPFHTWLGREDDLVHGLVAALEANNGTLRELALPVSELCATALEMAGLRKLRVLSLELRRENRSTTCNHEDGGVPAFMRLLQAVHGHADRSRKLTTLQELRLKNIYNPSRARIGGCSRRLFMQITTLRIDVGNCRSYRFASDVKFIILFPNLEYLYWNGLAEENSLRIIKGGCRIIKEWHLGPADGFVSARSMSFQHRLHRPVYGILEACQGKMKTLVLHENLTLTRANLTVLGEENPGLENLKIKIGFESIGGLSLLLGHHCRQMSGLHLFLCNINEVQMGGAGWQALTEALTSASDTLCDIDIETWSICGRYDNVMEAAVRFMVDALEFLRERARKVTFRVPVFGANRFVLVDAVNLILRTCTTHTRDLEILQANFVKRVADGSLHHEQQERESFAVLLKEKEKLLAALPNLHSMDVGGLDKCAEELYDDATG